MKKLYIQLLIVLLACGCTKQDDTIIGNDTLAVGKSFSVKTEDVHQGETKAHIGEGLKVVFDNEDKLAVFDQNTAPSQYIYSDETQKFSGESVATGTEISDVFAFYPYSASVTCDGTKIEATLPAVQEYEENSFSNDSHIMFGITDEVENNITLKNMCGYIKLKLYATEQTVVKEILLSSLDNTQVVSGDFYISKESEEIEHSLKMYAIDADGHDKQSGSVTLDCSAQEGGGVTLSKDSNNPTIFYIAVPAQEYSKGFKITVTDIYGREITKSASTAFTLERSHIKPMAALNIDMNSVITIKTDANGNAYVTAEPVENKFPIEKFLKWGYLVNYCNNKLGIELTGNVYMPQFVIEPDHVNKTYKITGTSITVTDGVPSGSNWESLGTHIGSEDLSKVFKGNIEGCNHYIKGLYIKELYTTGVGFIGEFANGSVRNLTITESYIYGNEDATGGVVGDNRYNTIIENVNISKTHIVGNNIVGGIVGYNYRRRQNASQTHERISHIINCTTDENSTINGTSYVGGICGYNQSHSIVNCINNADITGTNFVGGIAGETRTYTNQSVNGYVIASGSSETATIKATEGMAGGIAGRNWRNKDHLPSESYIVACYSLSTVDAKKAGSLIGSAYGSTIHIGLIYSSFADKKDLTKLEGDGTPNYDTTGVFSSNHYASANDITEQIVNDMNSTIDTYNSSVTDIQTDAIESIKCHYKWQYNAGNWPTLVKVEP